MSSSSSQWIDLVTLINEWNRKKFDLFSISLPREETLEFNGIMRFYYQEESRKVLSKCIRVDSKATCEDLILVLCEKILRIRKEAIYAKDYCIYEFFSETESRKLNKHDRPLWFQLNWVKSGNISKFFLIKEPQQNSTKINRVDVLKSTELYGKNRYEKITWLGEGSFGEAILVIDRISNNEKKILKKTKKQVTLEIVPEITKEAVIMASLHHSHIVTYYDCFYENGFFFIVTEYCEGGDLRRRINEYQEKKYIPRESQVLELAIQLSSALKYMHFEKNLIHKDVKPQNILIKVQDFKEIFKLGDFGFANDADTASSFKAGTLNYMSPERVCGKKADKYTDIWSLGVVLYEYCCKERPTLVNILDDKIALKEYSDNLNRILKAMLSIRSCKRPDSSQILSMLFECEFDNSKSAKLMVYDSTSQENSAFEFKNNKDNNVHEEFDRLNRNWHANETIRKTRPMTPEFLNSRKSSGAQTTKKQLVRPSTYTPNSTQDIRIIEKAYFNDLPGLLEFPNESENSILTHLSQSNAQTCSFKLAPVYTMYMMLRYKLSQQQQQQQPNNSQIIVKLIFKMVNMIRDCIDVHHMDKYQLPFWMANSSELLYFLKSDYQLKKISQDAQELLAEYVQMTFKYLVNLMQQSLDPVLNAFIDPSDHVEDISHDTYSIRPTLRSVINVLGDYLNKFKFCCVNTGLIIQIFSHIFHYISSWLLNKLINKNGLCCRYWGIKLVKRLKIIQNWSGKQGLELEADCHLSKITQAAYFLKAPKYTHENFTQIIRHVFMLNSLQLKALIRNYSYDEQEQKINEILVNNIIAISQCYVDELAKSKNELVKCDEDLNLQIPLLLPKDGYSSETLKGLPNELLKYCLEILYCKFYQNLNESSSWTMFLWPKIIDIQLNKQNGELGIKIVTQKNEMNLVSGIQVLNLIPGGVAHQDGRIKVGDLLIKINNQSLIGISHEKAHEIMNRSNSIVTLTVVRDEPKSCYSSYDILSEINCQCEEESTMQTSEEGYASFQTKSLEDFYRDASKISFINELN